LKRKPSYYYVKRALSPVLLSFVPKGQSLVVWITNDTLQTHSGLVRISYVNVQTDTCVEQSFDAVIEANRSKELVHLSLQDIPPEQRTGCVVCGQFDSAGKVLSRNRRLLVGFQLSDLPLPKTRLTTRLEAMDRTSHTLSVSSDHYAWMVQLQAGADVWVEDNYFDLLPRETRLIRVEGEPAEVARMRIHALNSGQEGALNRPENARTRSDGQA
jgi:beta-mannosidase